MTEDSSYNLSHGNAPKGYLSANMDPYHKLFIYELSDEISVKGDVIGRHFIGCLNEGKSSFLFFPRQHDEEVTKWLGHRGRGKLVSRHVMDYRDWQAGEDLKPLRIGKLVICPTWEEAKAFSGKKADMVLANLYFQAIDALLRREEFFSKRWIVLSGLFHGQANGVLASMEQWGFKLDDRMDENRWATLVLRRTP